jgi:carboxyl-terminal processing protease
MSVFEGGRLLRGQPGSKVTLTIIRGNAADPHDVALVREKPPAAQVSSRIIAPATGYLRITAFREGVATEIRRHATELTKSGARAFIIDVRRTAEGPLENGIAAARLFVPSGTLAQKAPRDEAAREVILAKEGDAAIDLPVTLLATTGTSGAAEIFIAALDGNARGEIVGERTLGRAGIQKLVKLPEGRGLWLTYARYLRPDGEPIQGRGIDPDLPVEEPSVEFGAPAPQGDPILDAALERIKAKAAA